MEKDIKKQYRINRIKKYEEKKLKKLNFRFFTLLIPIIMVTAYFIFTWFNYCCYKNDISYAISNAKAQHWNVSTDENYQRAIKAYQKFKSSNALMVFWTNTEPCEKTFIIVSIILLMSFYIYLTITLYKDEKKKLTKFYDSWISIYKCS